MDGSDSYQCFGDLGELAEALKPQKRCGAAEECVARAGVVNRVFEVLKVAVPQMPLGQPRFSSPVSA